MKTYLKNLWYAITGKYKYLLGSIQAAKQGIPQLNHMDDKYLIPVRFGYWGGGGTIGGIVYNTGTTMNVEYNGDSNSNVKEKPQMVPVTPREVLCELERIPTKWSLENIDEKIKILKDKESLITNSYSKRELSDLIRRMTNRKKYYSMDSTGKIFKEYFDLFDTTNDEKVDALIKKYPNLDFKEAELFIPEFPAEAINTMKEYNEKVKELNGQETKFAVIATKENFKEAYKKRDPILLAPSPFGFYYYILGAWDEEMLVLSEL